ncbi:MAG: hypothetical protein ROO73_02845 [Roseivirga sp.]
MSDRKKNVFQLTLTLCLLFTYPGQAQSRAINSQVRDASGQNKRAQLQTKREPSEWIDFPFTIQIGPYGGMTRPIFQQLERDSQTLKEQYLLFGGVSADVGVLQIRRFLWKHFYCYPKLGLAFNYGRLENKGNLVGGLIYLEPQYDYMAKCEFFPRLGIGILYASIPGTNFSEEPSEEEKQIEEKSDEEYFYHQGIHLDLSLALVWKIMLHPQWQLSPSLGFSYLPSLDQEDEEENKQVSSGNKDLKIVTASIGFSFTPNPSQLYYPDLGDRKKSRIDIGHISAFKKFEALPQISGNNQKGSKQQASTNDDDDNEGKYFYVGGIYGHWSLRVSNNHALTVATEWVWDGASKEAIKNTYKTDPWKASFLVGHEFWWGKIIFGQQLGCYVMNNHYLKGIPPVLQLFYARLGLDYRITDALFIGTSMKINAKLHERSAEIEFIDVRVGYSF